MKDSSKNQDNSSTYTINYSPNESSDMINPSLVVFPYNFPRLSSLNDVGEIEWQLGQNKEKKLKDDKSLVGLSSKIQYEARSKPNLNRSDYVLGFLSKKTNRTISIVDIDGIFPMQQKILKIDNENKKVLNLEDNTFAADKQTLMEQFGTAKAKKLALNMKTNMVDESNISSVQNAKYILQQAAITSDMFSNVEEIKHSQMSVMMEILPAFDLEVNKVRKIFDFESIVDNEKITEIDHKNILKILKSECNVLEESKGLYNEFVYDYLRGLIPKIKEEKNLSDKIKYALYMNELITFYHLPKTIRDTPEKISEIHHIELSHINIMLEKYAEKTIDSNSGRVNYIRNQTMILRNIYHILILALLLNGYEFNYTTLAKAMRMEMKTVMNYYRDIGCSFKSQKVTEGDTKKTKSEIVKLNAPLKLNTTFKNFAKKK